MGVRFFCGIFLIFSARGGGRGSLRRREGGGYRVFIENPRKGGGVCSPGRRGRGAANWGIWGGEAKCILFRGRNVHPRILGVPNEGHSGLEIFETIRDS